MKYLKHIMTPTTIQIATTKGVKSINVGNPTYAKVRECIKAKDFEGALDALDMGRTLFKGTNGVFDVVAGSIVYNGKPIPSRLSETILKFIKEKAPIKYLCVFWENLRRNPSTNSRNQLFDFLKANNISITEDGHFIAYKAVSNDFKSCNKNLDGTYNDNSPGRIVTMPRDEVDSDPTQTCSHGLHVCAINYIYAPDLNWTSNNRKIVEVKVNPRHVVAVPNDYNGMKMRVCQYEVLNEHRPHKGDKPTETAAYSFRTYYYKGRKGQDFKPNLVTGKKPSRFTLTVRATDTADATTKFKELV